MSKKCFVCASFTAIEGKGRTPADSIARRRTMPVVVSSVVPVISCFCAALSLSRVATTSDPSSPEMDVVFVELPDVGRTIKTGEPFGTIESVKAVSELFAPMDGEVVEVNTALKDHPEVVNSRPHDTWMIKIKLTAPDEIDELMNAEDYEDYIQTEAGK